VNKQDRVGCGVGSGVSWEHERCRSIRKGQGECRARGKESSKGKGLTGGWQGKVLTSGWQGRYRTKEVKFLK